MEQEIADKYGIKLHFVKRGDEYCRANGEESYINHSYCVGKEIWIGIYDDHELQLASFFHEVGHIIDPIDWSVNANETTKHKAEAWIWEIGFKLAETYGIFLSRKTKRWVKKQINTYIKYS